MDFAGHDREIDALDGWDAEILLGDPPQVDQRRLDRWLGVRHCKALDASLSTGSPRMALPPLLVTRIRDPTSTQLVTP